MALQNSRISISESSQAPSLETNNLGLRYFVMVAGMWTLAFWMIVLSLMYLRFSFPGNIGLRNYLHWRYQTFPRYFLESDAWKLFVVCVVSGVVFLAMEAWIGGKFGKRTPSGTLRGPSELVGASLLVAIVCSSLMATFFLGVGISIDDQYHRLTVDDLAICVSLMLIPWTFASVSGNLMGYLLLVGRLKLR